jgi:hypothetical protein
MEIEEGKEKTIYTKSVSPIEITPTEQKVIKSAHDGG